MSVFAFSSCVPAQRSSTLACTRLDDGRIPLDTILVENATRPFVVGSKNWLFADSVAWARVSLPWELDPLLPQNIRAEDLAD